MSDSVAPSPTSTTAPRSRRGQSLVEFALLLPLLLVLLLGIADFGRVFNAGIVVEAATRNGAEAGALDRLRAEPPITPGDPAFYDRIHRAAAQVACSEISILPNATYVADDPGTPSVPDDEICPEMPPIAVCVQDGSDPYCGNVISTYTGVVPPECTELSRTWESASGGAVGSHSVEVRICYRFTTLFNLHLSLPLNFGLNLGDVYLQRSRVFVVDCPPGDPISC